MVAQSLSAQKTKPNQRIKKNYRANIVKFDSIYSLTDAQKMDFKKIFQDYNRRIRRLNRQFQSKGRTIKQETKQTRKEIREELKPEFYDEKLELMKLRDARIYYILDDRQRAIMDQRREKQGYKELLLALNIISS